MLFHAIHNEDKAQTIFSVRGRLSKPKNKYEKKWILFSLLKHVVSGKSFLFFSLVLLLSFFFSAPVNKLERVWWENNFSNAITNNNNMSYMYIYICTLISLSNLPPATSATQHFFSSSHGPWSMVLVHPPRHWRQLQMYIEKDSDDDDECRVCV